MRTQSRIVLLALLVASLGALVQPAISASADTPKPVSRTWTRTDYSVSLGRISRTWMWGPFQVHTNVATEPYAESPNGVRQVFYFDKARMEVTQPDGDQNSIWYVTNGLLVRELVTGLLQVGDGSFEQWLPAQVNVAGDADDPNGPTYATFTSLLNASPAANGAVITQRLSRSGQVTNDPSLASSNVTAAYHLAVPGLDHQVASVFWDFMNSEGEVYQDGGFTTARLFVDPFYATGYPISEPYWANVKVGGTQRDVLMQCFERRCLTYTPDNSEGWKVEAGNVGQHYYTWRYSNSVGQIVYQPDLSQLVPDQQGGIHSYYDAPSSSWIIENTTSVSGAGAASAWYEGFPPSVAWPTDYSLSVTVVTLNNDTTYQSEAGIFYRLKTEGGATTTLGSTVLGMDGYVVSYYQNVQTGDVAQMASTGPVAFNTGYGAENTLEVRVQGAQVQIFLNGEFVHSFVLDARADPSANGFGFAAFRLSPGDQSVTSFGFKNVIVRELVGAQ